MTRSKNIPENILIGISGGIAAYKIPLLIRLLKKDKYNVKVVMTDNAGHFITKSVIETLSSNKAYDSLWQNKTDTEHISLSKWADLLIIAPATANIIGKCANGIADDLLSTVYLSFEGPVLFAPSMNTSMYSHDAVCNNLRKLRERGNTVIEPPAGELACGDTGKGRMPEPQSLFFSIKRSLSQKTLQGRNILITGGSFCRHIDPVRTLTNISSGRMARAFAVQSYILGADAVSLIEGEAAQCPMPDKVNIIKRSTPEELMESLHDMIGQYDILIMAAAVPDFDVDKSLSKIKSHEDTTLALTRGADILKSLKDAEILKIGFALETDNGRENALKKMQEKNLDYIILNGPDNIGAETASILIFSKEGDEMSMENKSKTLIAQEVLKWIK